MMIDVDAFQFIAGWFCDLLNDNSLLALDILALFTALPKGKIQTKTRRGGYVNRNGSCTEAFSTPR
jgi:hypothetical protein